MIKLNLYVSLLNKYSEILYFSFSHLSNDFNGETYIGIEITTNISDFKVHTKKSKKLIITVMSMHRSVV